MAQEAYDMIVVGAGTYHILANLLSLDVLLIVIASLHRLVRARSSTSIHSDPST